MRTFVIAEAGVNHNGDAGLALELVDAAGRSGADAIKFQTFSADRLVRRGAAKAAYQERETGSGDQHSMLHALELSESLHRSLLDRCASLGIEFMSTPFDVPALDFLLDLGIRRIKIASGDLTNEPFLEYAAVQGLPLIVSTGMATLDEIKRATEVIAVARRGAGRSSELAEAVTLLHCTSNYPARIEDVNLRAMQTIARETGLPVGYSDHTLGLTVSTAAVAMGACVIEKHFTLDRSLSGPDHSSSLTPDELTRLVSQIRDVEVALGSDVKAPVDSEIAVRDVVRRSVTLVRSLEAGQVLERRYLALMRPGTGIPPRDLAKIVGRQLARDLDAGTTLMWSDIR